MRFRALVIEDDPIQARMLERLIRLCPELEACGCTGDGDEGLELALSQGPDVILLDPILSGRSGLSILREYRARGGRARVLAITATPGVAAQEAILAAGADFVLVKPVTMAEIAEHIRLLCGGLRGELAARLEELDGGESRLVGRRYAIMAAEQLIKYPESSMKMVYLQIAEEEKTDFRCVEKDVRGYIKSLCTPKKCRTKGSLVQLWREGPPSNSVFLRALAEGVKFP